MIGVEQTPKPGYWAGVRHRLKLLALVGGGGIVAIGLLTSNIAAWWLGWGHPMLGKPVLGLFYAPWSILVWMRQPWPYAGPAFQLAGSAAMLVVGITAALAVQAWERNRRSPKPQAGLHGTARLMEEGELRKVGLLAPTRGASHQGIIIGAWTHDDGSVEYIRIASDMHIFLCGALRTGKSAAAAVTNLLTQTGYSIFIPDPKDELYPLTAGWRRKYAGSTILRWAPASLTNTLAFNFLAEIRIGTPYEYGDTSTIVEAVGDPTGGEDGKDHWIPTAIELIVAVTLFCLLRNRAEGRRTANFADVRNALSNPDQPADDLFRAMQQNELGHGGGRHQAIASAATAQLNRGEKERASVTSTATRMLRLWNDPIIARNAGHSDFRIADLMDHEKPVTLYLGIPEDRRAQLNPLARLFSSLAMSRLMSEGIPHKHRLWMFMEEFMSQGNNAPFVDRLSRSAGPGINAMIFVQDYPQVKDVYGHHEQVTGKCHVKIWHTPNDSETAAWISRACGPTTVVTEVFSEGGKIGERGKSYNRAYHSTSRPLITEEEAYRIRLPEKDAENRVVSRGQVLIRIGGQHTILAEQAFWFMDPVLLERAKVPAGETDQIAPRPFPGAARPRPSAPPPRQAPPGPPATRESRAALP
jgi:type IV secretion system protein VirD4